MPGYSISSINTIRNDLRDKYKTGFPILKELIQNADDAKAKTVIFGLDKGAMANKKSVNHPLLKGPSLWILNDGIFTPNDEKAILFYAINAKAGDAGTIGKFGLGMKSVFHFCESFFFRAKNHKILNCHINPRINPLVTAGFHFDNEITTSYDIEYIESVIKTNGFDQKPDWFLLWIPLRKSEQIQNGETALVQKFPGDKIQDLDFFNDPDTSNKLCKLLPLLKNLEEVRFQDTDGYNTFKINLKLEQSKNRLDHISENLEIKGTVDNNQGSINTLKFFGTQKAISDQISSKYGKIKELNSWPKSFVISSGGNEVERPDKAAAESAIMFSSLPNQSTVKTGNLTIQWAVFLPAEEEGFSYHSEIEGSAIEYHIVLHSQFFVDSGRRGIKGMDKLHVSQITDLKTNDNNEEGLNLHWNQALAQDLLLPEFLPTLAKYVEVENISNEEVTKLTLAIKSCVSGSLAGVEFYDTFKKFICKNHSWVMQLTDDNGVSWSLIDHSKTGGLLELPEPDSKQPQTPWNILPGLKKLNNFTFVAPGKPRLSKEISPWKSDLVKAVLESLDIGILKVPINLNFIVKFLEHVGTNILENIDIQTILIKKLRNFLTNEELSDIREYKDNFKNLLKYLKSGSIVGLGKSNPNTKGAISEHLYKVILAVESKSLVVPKDLHPHNVNNILDRNDLHSWLLAINQYYIKNNNVAPELIIETSKTIIEAAGDDSQQANFVRTCGQFRILGAFNGENGAEKVVSLAELKSANEKNNLFKIRNHNNRLGYISSLSMALPNLNAILVDSAVASYVESVYPEIPFCDDANAIIKCVGNNNQELGNIDSRKDLLTELVNKVNLNQPDIVKGIRYLLHNSLVNINDTQQLWIQPQDDQNALWVKILGIIDHDNWRIIPRDICAIIPYNIALALNLKTVNETSVLDRLNALQNYNLIDAKEFTADEITNLLGRVTIRNVWRQLPLHLDVNGHFGPITDESYCGNKPALPDDLNFDEIRFIEPSKELLYKRNQDEWIKKWNASIATEYVLKSKNPGLYWNYLMDHGQFNSLSSLLLKTPWLPLSNGSFIAIDKLIRLDTLTDKIKNLTRNCNYFWACPEDLHDEFRQHQSFGRIKSLISTGIKALPILGHLMIKNNLNVGKIQIANLNDLLPMLVNLNIPAWEYVESAVNESSIEAVQENLLPALSKELTQEEYRVTLIALSKINNSDKAITIFNMYLIALRNLKGATLVATDLVDLPLLSKAKNWVSAEQLVAGNLTGIDENSVLCDMHTEILKNVIVTNGANIANGGQENLDNNQNNQFNGSNLEKIVKYVEPLKNSDIKTAVGALIGLFGQGTKDIATEWLYPITYQSFINSIGWQDPGFNIINNTWNWMSRLTVEEALNSQNINLLIQNGGEINLISIIGMDVTVSSIPIDNISTLFLGSENYEENNVINIPLHPISVLDGKSRNEKLKIIHETCKLLLFKIYNQNHANLNNFFSNLSTAEQISLDIARTLIIEGLPQMLRTLPGVNRNTILSNAIRNLDQQRRELASAKHNNLNTHNFTINLVNANDELANCVIDNYDVQKIILDAIRERVTHNQYEFSSIPFEIFQNADDAIVEMQNLQKNEERKEYKDIEIGRIVIKQNNYEKTIRKLKNDDNQIENRVIKLNKNINSINFAHWGRPINYAGSSANTFPEYCNDLERMLMLGASAKDAGENLTGKFGLGFKSLLLASTTPRVWSGDIAFEVVAGCLPEKLNASPNFIQFRNEIPTINQSSLRGTFIELPLDDGIVPTNVLDRFSSLAGLLPVFARNIVCVEVDDDIHNWMPIDNQILTLGENKIEIGEVFIPPKVGKTKTKLLVFRSNSGTIAMRIGVSGFEKFDGNADFPVPILWVTAPTRGTAARGVLMNGAFQIDTGRATLAQSQDSQKKNNDIAAKIASEIGPMLVELYSRNWDELNKFLGLDLSILAPKFWYSLWDKLIGEQPSEDAATDVKLLDIFGSAVFKYFIEKVGKVPNGLGGFSDIKEIKLSLNTEYYKNTIPKIENWELFTNNYPKDNWCSKDIISWLIRLNHLENADIEEFGLRTVFKCFNDNLLKPLEINSLANILKAWPQNALIGNEHISNYFTNIKLQTKETNIYIPISSIIDRKSKDYIDLSSFAPNNRLLSDDYLEYEDAFSHIENYFQYQTPSDNEIASWCISADTKEKKEAVIEWFNRNLYGSIIDKIKEKCRNCWLFDLNYNSPILNNLSRAERGVLIFKLVGKYEGPNGIPDPISIITSKTPLVVETKFSINTSKTPLVVGTKLESLYKWWESNDNKWTTTFDERLWPNIDIRQKLKGGFDREAWMTLFSLGIFRKFGRTTDQQHRGFIEYLATRKWWDIICNEDPIDGETKWIGIIKEYVEEKQTDTVFEQWMDSFPRLYRVARWLGVYAHLFSSFDERDLKQANLLLTPAADHSLTGSGIMAPTLSNILHIGQHLVIRELLRAGVLNSEVAKSMAFAPRYSVRKLLNEMGYSQFNEDSKSNDIYELLKRELKCSKKATFNGAYDIPLQLLATDENARSDFNKWAKKNSFEQIK